MYRIEIDYILKDISLDFEMSIHVLRGSNNNLYETFVLYTSINKPTYSSVPCYIPVFCLLPLYVVTGQYPFELGFVINMCLFISVHYNARTLWPYFCFLSTMKA